jgi:hypothetical protein
MWGNRLGWGISLVIVIVTMVLLYLFAQMVGTVTPPTELVTSGGALEAIELPAPPRSVVPEVMVADCDAGELYWRAIDAYLANPRPYEHFLAQPNAGASLPEIKLLLEAAACSRMRLFIDRPDAVVTYASEKPPIRAIADLGRATIVTGLLNKSDPRVALAHYEAAFSLGTKLYEERVVYAELEAGLQLMSQAAQAMAKLADEQGHAGRAGDLREFDRQRLEYYKQRIEPVLRAVSSIGERVVDRHAGDVNRLAQQAGERLWRIEATLALGRQRYFVGRAGDQRGAVRTLKTLQEDSDPAVQLAAKKALELTLEDYRQLR